MHEDSTAQYETRAAVMRLLVRGSFLKSTYEQLVTGLHMAKRILLKIGTIN